MSECNIKANLFHWECTGFSNLWQRTIRVHIKCTLLHAIDEWCPTEANSDTYWMHRNTQEITVTHGNAQECTGNMNNSQQRPLWTPEKWVNESLGQTLIIKNRIDESNSLTPCCFFLVFYILCCCCYDGYCLTKNSTPKFLTHNKNKNTNEICANLYNA